jgi:hypothetical protein
VEVFAGPTVGHVEIFVHVVSVSSERFWEQGRVSPRVDWVLRPL